MRKKAEVRVDYKLPILSYTQLTDLQPNLPPPATFRSAIYNMKRKRTSGEDEESTVQPLSGLEPEPSAGENSEPDDGEDAQQPAAEEKDKRRKLQRKLNKLKETYENKPTSRGDKAPQT